MMALTPGAQIDELRRVLRESEQRRQVAEIKLADCERRLGTARDTIATQDHRINSLMAELGHPGFYARLVPCDRCAARPGDERSTRPDVGGWTGGRGGRRL